jgi:hypothetical protein
VPVLLFLSLVVFWFNVGHVHCETATAHPTARGLAIPWQVDEREIGAS